MLQYKQQQHKSTHSMNPLQQHKKKQPSYSICLQQQKQIRSLIFIHNNILLCLMSLLQILIIQPSTGMLIKIIKRLSTPKYIYAVGQCYLLIHYSDNYCILYDTFMFEEVYVVIGIPNDHKGIKASGDGLHLLYGNDTAIQMWNTNRCYIQMLSHKMKYIGSYNININGSYIYLGNYNGQLQLVQTLTVKQLNNNKIPYSSIIKVHSKVIVSIEILDKEILATIDYGMQCALVKLVLLKYQILCKIDIAVMMNKPLVFLYSRQSNRLYLNLNDYVYAISNINRQVLQQKEAEKGQQFKLLTNQGNIVLIKRGNSVMIGKLQKQSKWKIELYAEN